MLEAMDPMLLNLTKYEFKGILQEQGLSENFIEEMIQAITFVNYGQDLSIHSFVGKEYLSLGYTCSCMQYNNYI